MSFGRVYEPRSDEILYHYCDADAFHAICTYKTMRFSDLNSMNDFMETRWGYHIWEEAATDLLPQLGEPFLDRIDLILHRFGIHGLVTAACFSRDGDVLSQWRAYADDAGGYAIGFRASDLNSMGVTGLTVLYDKQEQIREVKATVLALHEIANSGKPGSDAELAEACNLFAVFLAGFKNPAFAEEQEIRFVRLLDFQPSNDSLKLVDEGGTAFGREVSGGAVKYRMRRNAPVPYVDLDFSDEGRINPIKEVVLGPKNDSLPTGISVCLETHGIGKVQIRKSAASYW